jgi:hypothetical protein
MAMQTGVKRELGLTLVPGSDEEYYFDGTQEEVVEQIQTLVNVVNPAVANKDIGQFLGGEPDFSQTLTAQRRIITLNFNQYSAPPWKRSNRVGWKSTITIPDARPNLSYSDLRSIDRYQRGNVLCHVKFTNGRQMMGYFASPAEGERVFDKLSRLSTVRLDKDTFRSSTGKSRKATENVGTAHISFASVFYPKRSEVTKTNPRLGTNRKIWLYSSTPIEKFTPIK